MSRMVKKISIVTVLIIVVFIVIQFIYRYQYINGYRKIELSLINELLCTDLNVATPHWISLTGKSEIKNFEKKYNVSLGDVKSEKMILISYGAEIKNMDYNVKDRTFKTRGFYIAFPNYGESKPNMIFVYETDILPIGYAEVAGFSPEYRGKYR